MTRYPSWPLGPLQDCKHLCVNQWLDLSGKLYPDGLPFEVGSIDFEWCCTEPGAKSIAPLIGSAQDSTTGEIYVWLSDRLVNQNYSPRLCHVGPKPRVLRAHNAEADRSKVFESHQFVDPIRWHCTMSTHVLLAGASSGQSMLMRKAASGGFKPWFAGYTALKNIVDVHNFWVLDSELVPESKEIREIFYKGSMSDIREKFEELMTYSLKDAVLVNEIACAQEPVLQDSMPSSIRQEALGIRGNVSLSLAPWFKQWVENCEVLYQSESKMLNVMAQDLAKLRLSEFKAELAKTQKTYTLEELPPEFRVKKGLGKLMAKYKTLDSWLLNVALNLDTQAVVTKWNTKYRTRDWTPNNAGIPSWAKSIDNVTYESPLTQDLADLQYFSQEVTYEPGQKGRKFCYVDKITGFIEKVFSPKKGPSTKDNCGSLFAADFIPLYEEGSITSEEPLAIAIVAKAAELSYWVSIRARMFKMCLQEELLACDLDHTCLPSTRAIIRE